MAARTLAEYLQRISGAKFEVSTGDGKEGIAVGTAPDFPALPFAGEFPTDATRREDYVLRSHDAGIYLIGSTELAVRHAVWDLLYRLGHRQFFPAAAWEVVPRTPDLSIAVSIREHPDYLSRRIWYGFGSWKENMQDKARWDACNRMAEGLDINAGHAYDTVNKAKKAEFERHPEYLCSEHPTKFCVSDPGLRKLVVEYALEYFRQNPDRDSISLEPSDGGGWECAGGACQDDKVYKNVTDRVVTLANEVAAAVNEKYKNKYVGIYAYYQHSPPPTIKVHPNVIVHVATAFIQGGFSFNQLMQGWHGQGAQILGVREYYDFFDRAKGRPGGTSDSNLTRMGNSVRRYYAMGARAMSAESNENWGAGGLGMYIAARLLWNTTEKPDAIIEDFLQKAFGPAKEPMRAFYHDTDRAQQPLFTRDLIGRMYRHLDAARKLTNDPATRARLDDLVLFTRYSEMLWELETSTKDKKAAGEAMLRFTWRFHRSGMLHTYVLWRHSYLLEGKKPASYPEDTKYNVPEGKNPWKSNEPIPADEIEGYVQRGIANNPVAEFVPVQFSNDLMPAGTLNLPATTPAGFGYIRMAHSFFVWIENAPATIKLDVTGGQIATRGNTTLTLSPVKSGALEGNEEQGDEDETETAEPEDGQPAPLTLENTVAGPASNIAVSRIDVPNDRQMHSVELKATVKGLHRLSVQDRGKGAAVVWPHGLPVVIESSQKVQTLLRGRDSAMYFYVPKGTKVIGGFAQARPVITDGNGKVAASLPAAPAMFSIPVPAGQDGKVWKIDRIGKVLLMTVPPFLARSADEMLIPRQVLAADALR